ncbi:type II secretion system protein GspD, partial [Halomonas elongata]
SAPGATPGRQGGGDGRLGGASGEMAASTRITAQESSNQLLVRARPAQWKEIESAIERLDQPPRQVQIETRILEVRLTGALNQGVQWYLGQLAGNASNPSVANASGSQGALGAGGVSLGGSSMFYSFVGDNLQVALRALQTRGLTQVLSAPSLVVLNNQQAQIQVGDNIPVNQTTVNTADADTTLSSVEYVQTGVILNVVPRINPGGLVYMDIQQQVSDADDNAAGSTASNPRISTRAVSTQVAVQSGQTVLLGGLIQQNNAESETRVPGLSSIPGLGWLFGSEARDRDRTELIVLITPKVVNNPVQAREITNDYRRQMQLLKARMDEASSS